MNFGDANDIGIEQRQADSAPTGRAEHAAAWAFVYVFFSNGVPFDSPNRSEPCPPL